MVQCDWLSHRGLAGFVLKIQGCAIIDGGMFTPLYFVYRLDINTVDGVWIAEECIPMFGE